MTIRDLITTLKQFPEDAELGIYDKVVEFGMGGEPKLQICNYNIESIREINKAVFIELSYGDLWK